MKKLLFFMAIFLLGLVAIPVVSQDTIKPPDSLIITEPGVEAALVDISVPGVLANVDEHFYTFSAFVLLIPFVVEAIKGLTGAIGFGAQLISWLTGVLLAFAAWFLNIPGIFESLVWWQVLLVGFAGSIASNSVFDTGIITYILTKLGILKTT